MLGTITPDRDVMRRISQPSRRLAPKHLRSLAVFLSALLFVGCGSGGDGPPVSPSIPTSPTFTPPGASNPNELVGSVYRVESDRVFHVRGQRVEIPPDVAVSGIIVEGSYVRVRGSSSGAVFYATEIVVLGDGPAYQLDGQIEAVDSGLRTVHLLGLELLVNESAQGLGIGQWVSVRAHRNRFVQSLAGQYGAFVGHSAVEGGWFKDVLPLTRFTLQSVVDFTVQVSPTTDLLLSYRAGDGDCYGADPLSGDQFWQRAVESRPIGSTSVFAVGRFEGGLLIAQQVWLCYP
jgi:hypothetical protein